MKKIEVSIQVPDDMSWEDVKELEDDLSCACGDVLKAYNLKRLSHTRRIESDYSDRR